MRDRNSRERGGGGGGGAGGGGVVWGGGWGVVWVMRDRNSREREVKAQRAVESRFFLGEIFA